MTRGTGDSLLSARLIKRSSRTSEPPPDSTHTTNKDSHITSEGRRVKWESPNLAVCNFPVNGFCENFFSSPADCENHTRKIHLKRKQLPTSEGSCLTTGLIIGRLPSSTSAMMKIQSKSPEGSLPSRPRSCNLPRFSMKFRGMLATGGIVEELLVALRAAP